MALDVEARPVDAEQLDPCTPALRAGILKRIHVNQHAIRRNARADTREPPISVKTAGGSYHCSSVAIAGPSSVTYSPDKPLSCGARVWVETRAPIILS
jgi:hypothetical protein